MGESMTPLLGKTRGCLYGGAIGDALGAPAEWKTPAQIRERYGAIESFVEPWDGPSPLGKGDGRYTDDTLMVQALCQAYREHGDHLDPFAFARRIVPLIADEPRWVPERGREMPLVERLFYPEKWLLIRLRLANADPRLGGVGNMVNCGAAMYAAPVGIVNAADPAAAYREAIDVFSAHQWSYGLEAAGVMAACVAEAFRPGASVDSIVATALRVAKEGTRQAIDAVVNQAAGLVDWREAIGPLRDALRPFDGAAEAGPGDRGNETDDWRPSRLKSIEEVPIALGFLVVAAGDFQQSVIGAANYGRDNDSIAGMAGAIAGALHGDGAIPPDWMRTIDTANRT
ncbi:MAG TPA: ADP-ribosylglycohydrolase family protein, partial [Thermomicrobiales bacterium]|nr:ADP-ribosylglycohydrolase family protein [Thermomicrobiales bacterium]